MSVNQNHFQPIAVDYGESAGAIVKERSLATEYNYKKKTLKELRQWWKVWHTFQVFPQ